jgi:hypothetical protein
MKRTPWIERKFSFDLPEGWIFNIMERLRGSPLRIREMVDGVSEDRLTYKPGGKWSIKEQIGHLIDLESLHDGRLEDFREGKEVLRAADMSNKATEEAHHNTRDIRQMVDDFEAGRTKFLSHLASLDDSVHSRISLHPRLKIMMKPVDMACFCAEHDDHHITTIRELLQM